MAVFMKKLIWLSLFCLLAGNAWAEPTVGLSEEKIKASVGEAIAVDIVMTGFPTTEGGGVTLEFNPDVIRIISVQLNEVAWNFVRREGVVDNEAGQVKDLLFSSFSGVSGAAVIATVTLEGLKKGRSQLKLVESSLNPFASGGQSLDVTFRKSVVRVR